MSFFIAAGILVMFGLGLMLYNYIERPDNDSGPQNAYNAGERPEYHPHWPPENERLSHQMRRWWEL
jgi:hypothetical protein